MAKQQHFRHRPPDQGKRIGAPHDNAPPNYDKEPPIFCFRLLEKGFCISDCQQEEKAAFADRLREMSSLTWEQLRQADRHKQGFEKIARNAIKSGIPKEATEDTTLLAFRFYGKAPMVGFRAGPLFRVIWLDRAFKLYNH